MTDPTRLERPRSLPQLVPSVAFSPTDTLPLSRAAKVLMMTQATIALITITVVAGTAINALASNA